MGYPIKNLTKAYRRNCANGQNVMAQFYFEGQRVIATIQDNAEVLTFDVKGRGNITIATGVCYEKYDERYNSINDLISYAWTPDHPNYSAVQDDNYLTEEAFDGYEIYRAIYKFFMGY